MIIPENVNFEIFYWRTKKKGKKVQSRYTGVYCKPVTKMVKGRIDSFNIFWCAKVQHKTSRFVKHFPFTKEGELAARQAYLDFLKQHGLSERNKTKRQLNLT